MLKKAAQKFHEIVVRRAGGLVPRLIFANDAGTANNVIPRLKLWMFRRRMNGTFHPVSAPDADVLKREGFVVLDLGADASTVATIARKFADLVNDPNASICSSRVGDREAVRHIPEPEKKIPEIKHLLTPRVQEILKGYYGTHFTVRWISAWRNNHIPPEMRRGDIASDRWHNDQYPVTSLRLFVFLTDGVTPETGATQLHTRGVTRRIMRSGLYFGRNTFMGPAKRLIDDKNDIRYFEGNRGSAFVFNPQILLHRASIPGPGAHRDLIEFYIEPADAPLPDNWIDTIPRDLVA